VFARMVASADGSADPHDVELFGRFVAALESLDQPRPETANKEHHMSEIRTVDGLREAYPELVARMVETAVAPEKGRADKAEGALSTAAEETKRLTASVAAVEKERDEQKERADKAEAEVADLKADAEVARMVQSAGLSEVPDWFRAQLKASDEPTRKAMLEDRKKLGGAKSTVTGNGAQSTIETGRTTEAAKEQDEFLSMPYWGGKPKPNDDGDIVVKIPKSALRAD